MMAEVLTKQGKALPDDDATALERANGMREEVAYDAAGRVTGVEAHDAATLGAALSPDDTGYTNGPLSWPQGIKSDTKGNIWIANCGSDSTRCRC